MPNTAVRLQKKLASENAGEHNNLRIFRFSQDVDPLFVVYYTWELGYWRGNSDAFTSTNIQAFNAFHGAER